VFEFRNLPCLPQFKNVIRIARSGTRFATLRPFGLRLGPGPMCAMRRAPRKREMGQLAMIDSIRRDFVGLRLNSSREVFGAAQGTSGGSRGAVGVRIVRRRARLSRSRHA